MEQVLADVRRQPAPAASLRRAPHPHGAPVMPAQPTRSVERAVGNGGVAQLSAPALPLRLFRCGPTPCDCPPEERLRKTQDGLSISDPADPAEREAEQVADQVVARVQGGPPAPASHDHQAGGVSARIALAVRTAGRPLDEGARRDMESRFGAPFGDVRLHTGLEAAALAAEVHASAFTTGQHVFFGLDQYRPDEAGGQRLLAHELTHVLQQSEDRGSHGSLARLVQRQVADVSSSDADLAAEREYGNKPAPKAKKCGKNPDCPPGFCDPYSSQPLAEYYRSKNAWWLMAGISAAVDSKVVPLWKEYLWGGSPPKDLSSEFGKEFTASPTTRKTTAFLHQELKSKLTASPPKVPPSTTSSVGIDQLIPTAIAALRDPWGKDQMNFNHPRDIPGNLAGGIGADQTACPAGAQPSPFNDDRRAHGTVELTRGTGTEVTATPKINYTVKDTIDLCPGDCGTRLEQVATVSLSQFEATGIAGDVPFTVNFPAPSLGGFTVPALP